MSPDGMRAKNCKHVEAKKVPVSGFKILLLWQCLVHLLPISVTVAILFINLRGVYVGVDFPGLIKSDTIALMLLQISAKVHEIVIVASLSQIILHVVRYELLHRDG